MKIKIWDNFVKRKNSTLRPSDGLELNVVLKEDTSVENPVFLVSEPLKYISYVQGLGHYYFVDDVVSIAKNLTEIRCSQDTLATYADVIKSSVCFVERAASAYDDKINDPLLSAQQDLLFDSSSNIDIGWGTSGMYVIPVSGITGVQYVVFNSASDAGIFYQGNSYTAANGSGVTLSLSTIWQQATDVIDIFKHIGLSMIDPTQYMGALMYFPVQDSSAIGQIADMKVGMWSTGQPCNVLLRQGWEIDIALTFPVGPYTDFRKYNSSFTRYSVYLPSLGSVFVPSIDVAQGDLHCKITIDYHTGAGFFVIYHSNGDIVSTFSSQVGVAVPYGKSNQNMGNVISSGMAMASSAVGGAGSGLGGAGLASSILGLEQGIVQTFQAGFDNRACVFGGSGSVAALRSNPDVVCSTYAVGSKEFPLSECGRPLCEHKTIGDLSGYVKCANANIPINGFDSDRVTINNYLNSGIYIE